MTLLICTLAVYKVVQLLDALTPKEAMPWVKVIAGCLLSLVAVGLSEPMGNDSVGSFILHSLAIATMAGTVHTVLRLLTQLGDRQRKTMR